MSNILNKLTNTKTVLAIASTIILILTTIGLEFNNETVMTIIKAICSILVMLGIMNDNGMDTTEWDK